MNQFQKDGCDEEIISDATVKKDKWSGSKKTVKIDTRDDDKPTDIVINVEAKKSKSIPTRGTIFK